MKTQDFLRGLGNLSAQELIVIDRFEANPSGPGFASVAEILRRRGHVIEAIVVLEEGLKRFPKVASARAALAGDYLSEGMVLESLREALHVLDDAPDNALANRLALKLLVHLGRQDEAMERLRALEKLVPDDSSTADLRRLLAANDWFGSQQLVRREWQQLGITVDESLDSGAAAPQLPLGSNSFSGQQTQRILPENSGTSTPSTKGSWSVPSTVNAAPNQTARERQGLNAASEQRSAPRSMSTPVGLDGPRDNNSAPEALRAGASLAHIKGDEDRYLLLRGFRSVAVGGYFFRHGRSSERADSIERSTLAEIYRAQGMTLRALELYTELLKEQPANHDFQRIYEELRNELKVQFINGEEPTTQLNRAGSASSKAETSPAPGLTKEPKTSDAQNQNRIERLRLLLGRLDAEKTSP